jgi:hypothetical protein
MVEFNKKVASSSGNIDFELIELFSKKNSIPMLNLSMKGFSES